MNFPHIPLARHKCETHMMIETNIPYQVVVWRVTHIHTHIIGPLLSCETHTRDSHVTARRRDTFFKRGLRPQNEERIHIAYSM